MAKNILTYYSKAVIIVQMIDYLIVSIKEFLVANEMVERKEVIIVVSKGYLKAELIGKVIDYLKISIKEYHMGYEIKTSQVIMVISEYYSKAE